MTSRPMSTAGAARASCLNAKGQPGDCPGCLCLSYPLTQVACLIPAASRPETRRRSRDSEQLVRFIHRAGGIGRVTISADLIGIALGHRRAADHDLNLAAYLRFL